MKELISDILVLFALIMSILVLLIIAAFLFQKLSGKRLTICQEPCTKVQGVFGFLSTSKIKFSQYQKISEVMAKKYLLLGFVISLSASLGSFYYSEILLYEPCLLCWYQRAFLFPQVLIFGAAWLWNNKKVVNYLIALSVVGGIISLYHHLLQLGMFNEGFCSTLNEVSCSQVYFIHYGFITIPMMALVIFALLIILGINFKKHLKFG